MLALFVLGVLAVIVGFYYKKHKDQQQRHYNTVNNAFKGMVDWLLNSDAVIIDTETTGLTKRSEVVELSIINLRGEVLFNSLIKPTMRIANNSKAVQIHGITYDQLKDSPTWDKVHREVCDILRGKTVIAYNAEFDVRILQQTAKKYGLSLPDFNSECAMMLYSFWHGAPSEKQGYKWHKLEAACQELGVKIEGNSHRALTDCLSTLGVLQSLNGKDIRPRKKFL